MTAVHRHGFARLNAGQGKARFGIGGTEGRQLLERFEQGPGRGSRINQSVDLKHILSDGLDTFGSQPVEFSLGKSWEGQTLRTLPDGRQERLTLSARITGRETIAVPAGSFETWVVEATVFITPLYNAPALTNRMKSWLDPRYGIPVQRTEFVRNTGGAIVRSELRQLASLKAPRD